jgi:hypothetical protein
MAKQKHEKNHSAHWISTGAASILEIGIFHPCDTMQKRLMKNSETIYDFRKPVGVNLRSACNIAFMDPKTHHFSLYPGLAWAASYKLLQRGYKFGGQPIIEQLLQDKFGKDNKFWASGLSGAVMGAGEVVFLPLDIYKIRKQTGSTDSGISYRAIHVTVLRNVIGSSLLFGVTELAQTKLAREKELTRSQKIGTQALGAVACLVASNPLDVVKTRLQADKNSESAWSVTRNLARTNPSQFFKSLGPKVLTQGLKLTFFMAAKDKIEEVFQEKASKINSTPR